jgi:uncharacterized protein with HEPN domain
MRDACLEALSFVKEKSRSHLNDDRMLVLSLVKCIEIVGEAASRVSDDMKSEHSDIPWREITGMRNRLIHAYFDVDLDVVWKTVNDELPGLVKKIEPIVLGR